MAYKMATGNGPNIGNVLPTNDPTDPKKKTTTTTSERTEQNGVSGTLTTFTTTTPGGGGGEGSGSIPVRTPEGDKAYAAKSTAEQKAQDTRWKAMNAVTPDEIDVTSRFLPDALDMKPYPAVPLKAEFTPGVEIKPRAKAFNFNDSSGRHFNMQQVNQNFGGWTRTSQTSEPVANIYTGVNPNWGDKNYGHVTKSRPITNYENTLLSSSFGRKTGGSTATPYGKYGEEGYQRYLGQIEGGLIKRTNTLNARAENMQPRLDAWNAQKAEKLNARAEKLNARKNGNN